MQLTPPKEVVKPESFHRAWVFHLYPKISNSIDISFPASLGRRSIEGAHEEKIHWHFFRKKQSVLSPSAQRPILSSFSIFNQQM